jgi:CheY-like chemotaxis protein
MTLLIVEDDESLRHVLAETSRKLAAEMDVPLAIAQAGNLAAALRLIDGADAVLCDGEFPKDIGGAADENWLAVAAEAEARSMPFAMLSGSRMAATLARMHGHAAFEKPGQGRLAISCLLHSLRRALRMRSQGPGENPVVREEDADGRENDA